MADDPTGRPKPRARRHRQSRSTSPTSAPGTPETIKPTPAELDDSAAEPLAIETTDAVEPIDTRPLASEPGAALVTAWPMLDGTSPNEWVCPFLRSADEHERLDLPIEGPDTTNRCAALVDVVPQSLRQQELVCLTTSHVNCPRYLRGAVVAVDPAAGRARSTPTMTPAMLGALALLAAAFTASVVFTLARGGLNLPAAGLGSARPSSSAIAVAPSVAPSVGTPPSASTQPSLSATEPPPPSVTPTIEPGPTVEPSVTSSASPAPSSDRYALLTACPDKLDCWLYRIRSGDNLFSIARYFGIPIATVKALNPWTASGLTVGRDLILPPPTR